MRRGRHARSLVLDVLAALERVSRHRLLSRLIRGRSWIGLLAFALIGIVTLQLALLKLNTSVGRALEREGALQRENSVLSIENSELASTDHVQARAAQLGMEFASSASLRFLTAHPRADVARAAAAAAAQTRSGGGEETGASPSSSGSGATSASGGEATAAAPGEASSARSGAAEGGAQTSQTPSQAGSERPAGETSSGETSSGETGVSQAPARSQSATSGAEAGSGSSAGAEATPAGGTQASPQG